MRSLGKSCATKEVWAVGNRKARSISYEGKIEPIIMCTLPPYPAYSPSGVDWLGDVPEHWEVVRLGRIGVFVQRLWRNANWDGEVPDGTTVMSGKLKTATLRTDTS